MERSERFFRRWRMDSGRAPAPASGNARPTTVTAPSDPSFDLVEETALRISTSLVLACDLRDLALQIVAHSARVAVVASKMGGLLGLRDQELRTVDRAAQLHEIGMISVPVELLSRPGPLTVEELSRVRQQAQVGAEIVRAANGARTANLVSWQYRDYADLAGDGSIDGADLLLAGIFGVADTLDALRHPRPYQRSLAQADQAAVLRSGLGSRFHPLGVHAGLRYLGDPA